MHRNASARRLGAAAVLSIACITLLAACGSTADTQRSAGDTNEPLPAVPLDEHGQPLYGDDPLTGDVAIIRVSGMGCPMCATNVKLELEDVEGVESAKVNLGTGEVTAELADAPKPTRRQLQQAVLRGGFDTLGITSR